MMKSQTILVADNSGRHTGGYVDKEVAHTGNGKRHLAITVLLYNSNGQVLLQHRKHKIHNDIWDFSGSTHHLHKADGTDETTEEATYRCLREEWGIKARIDLKILGGVNYFAKDGKYCENEHDIIVVGKWDGVLKPNKTVNYGHKWVDEAWLLKDIKKNPKKYAPWAVMGAGLINRNDEFEILLAKFLSEFEPYSRNYFKNKQKEIKKYPTLIGDIYSDLEDISAGGKRVRGFLVYLGFLVGGGHNLKKILPVSMAIELLHTFLLIHDDIIDKSDIRRGKLTIHKRYEKKFDYHYGISQAIVAGDTACFEAIDLINSSNFDSKRKKLCLEVISKVILETTYGELLDVEYSYKRPKLKQIEQVTDLKTARYTFVGPLTIGAILAGARKSQLSAINRYGLKVGYIFQLVDDILGVFGNEEILGKSTLSDMREGKNTLLIYNARELATLPDKKRLDKLWGKDDADEGDLKIVKDIIKRCGAYDWCITEINSLSRKSSAYLSDITDDEKLRKVFLQMAEFIVSRTK